MRVFITGGTGLIGTELTRSLLKQGASVTIYTRNALQAQQKLGTDVKCCTDLDSLKSFNDFDAVVNLAGEPIAPGRWTVEKKKRITKSRWDITQMLVDRIQAATTPPAVFLSGSAVGYYGNQENTTVTENAVGQPSFLQSVCQEWEARALKATSEKTRVVISRTGLVMSAKGGMLAKLLPIFRLGLGAPIGSGQQGLSWVHIQDMVNMLIFLLHNDKAQGVFNLTAPTPVSNRVFSETLAQALHRFCLVRIPAWVMTLALGEAARLILEGQYVSSQKIMDLGFTFSFPTLDLALQDIIEHGN